MIDLDHMAPFVWTAPFVGDGSVRLEMGVKDIDVVLHYTSDYSIRLWRQDMHQTNAVPGRFEVQWLVSEEFEIWLVHCRQASGSATAWWYDSWEGLEVQAGGTSVLLFAVARFDRLDQSRRHTAEYERWCSADSGPGGCTYEVGSGPWYLGVGIFGADQSAFHQDRRVAAVETAVDCDQSSFPGH